MARSPRNGDDLAPFLWLDQKYYLADDILTKSDRMSMAHSVEVRPAFLDHRIVEFAAKLPARMKIDGSRQKVILKDLMKDKLPPAIIHAQKNRIRHSCARMDAHHSCAICWMTRCSLACRNTAISSTAPASKN